MAVAREQLEKEVQIEFFRSGGPGGQHRNKVETGVRLRHRPTGITVSATERRSQARNRELAFERLEQALARRARRRKPRVPTRPSPASEERRLAEKRRRARRKQARRDPEAE